MLAIGLMSGTSLDGIDAALIETDGESMVRPLGFVGVEYGKLERVELMRATELALSYDAPRMTAPMLAAERLLTEAHISVVRALIERTGVVPDDVEVIGFHGQTVAHRPDRGWTWQIGDGAGLARAAGIRVVDDFRSQDVAAGGQGAPLLPVYHAALADNLDKPVAVLNLGGVANITLIGADGTLIAFDTGPANGLIDNWVEAHTGARFDEGGALAANGRVDEEVLGRMMDHDFFAQSPPKSLDRADFTIAAAAGLTLEDGAATLTAFTAATVAASLAHLPGAPKRVFVAGGGRHNATLLRMIAERTGLIPEPAETLGINGDAVEAEGFAYMAVRSLRRLPISFPGTTGVPQPMSGGTLHVP